MTKSTSKPSVVRTARQAGIWYLILAICGGFAEFFVRQRLIAPDDAGATADNILASASLFRLGIGAELVGQVVFVLLGLALYEILKLVNRRRALFMIALVLVAVAITCVNMVNQFAALLVLDGGPLAGGLEVAQREALALTFLDMHRIGYSVVAQVFFGLWLIPLGLLIFRSGFLPRLIGILLVVAGAGYLVDVTLLTLAPGVDFVLSEFTFVGELLLMFWLLVKGVNTKSMKSQTIPAMTIVAP